MADVRIQDLQLVPEIDPQDRFPLEHQDDAWALEAQTLINWITAAADGHGGIKIPWHIVDSVGLVDTYEAEMADGTKTTFDLKNGDSGVYIGTEPVPRTANVWLDTTETANPVLKVRNGDAWQIIESTQGDPAILVSEKRTYQVSDSGTVVPSGPWLPDRPAAKGQYIWTKTVQTWNHGEPTEYVSAEYQGMDGLGTVNIINGVSASPDGRVDLTPANIGAAPASTAIRKNLLDNWFFENPVNQRGGTQYVGAGYGIDRWKLNSQACDLSVEKNGIHMRYNARGISEATETAEQKIRYGENLVGKKLTVSAIVKGNVRVYGYPHVEAAPEYVNYPDFTLVSYTFTAPPTLESGGMRVDIQGPNKSEWWCKACKLEIGENQTLAHFENGQWVLSEVPDFSNELETARKFYRPLNSTNYLASYPAFVSGGARDILICFEDEMADIPDILGTAKIVIRTSTGYCPDASYESPAEPAASARSERAIILKKQDSTPWAGITNNTPISVVINEGSTLSLSSED